MPMAYMAQQWLSSAAQAAYRDRPDAFEQAEEAARVRAWLETLSLERTAVAALVEPVAALEEGLRRAAGSPVTGDRGAAPRDSSAPD